jgi:hypothetical protein
MDESNDFRRTAGRLAGTWKNAERSKSRIDRKSFERAMGIEPTSEAWEASIKLQKRSNWRHFDVFQVSQLDSNWSGRRLSALDDLKP